MTKIMFPLLLTKKGTPRKRQKDVSISVNGYQYRMKRGVPIVPDSRLVMAGIFMIFRNERIKIL